MSAPSRSREAWVAIVLIIAAVALIPTVLFLGLSSGGMMGGGSAMGGGWIGVVGTLAVVGVVALALLLLRPGAVQPVIPPPDAFLAPPPASGSEAMQILDARYARGELTRDEYLAMRDDLQSRNR